MTTQQFFVRVVGGTVVGAVTLVVIGYFLLYVLPLAPYFFEGFKKGFFGM